MPGAYCLVARTYDGAATDVAVRIGRLEHEPLTAGSGGWLRVQRAGSRGGSR